MEAKLSNLITAKLAGTDNKEVVICHVVLPPHSNLPMHYHPGEEFAYIIDGSVELLTETEEPLVLKKDDFHMVGHEQVHSIRTRESGVTILVFRVHECGQPERFLVG